jgi:hypothetical protein
LGLEAMMYERAIKVILLSAETLKSQSVLKISFLGSSEVAKNLISQHFNQ